MRAFITTILFFITFSLCAQPDFRLDTSRKTVDSLFNKLNNLSKDVGEHGVDIPAPTGRFKWLIKSDGNGSTEIMFHTDDGKLLFRKVNRYDKQKCRWWDAFEVYNSSGNLVYCEVWKWSCLKASEKTDPDVKYYDALIYEKQRFVYDSFGRLKERVWWYAPIGGVRKYSYSYDSNNEQTYILTKHQEASFWE